MLETILIAVVTAGLTAVLVDFGLHWTLRVQLRRLDSELADLQDGLLSEKRRRAALASVQARTSKLNELDEAIVKSHVGAGEQRVDDDAPWWSGLTKAQ